MSERRWDLMVLKDFSMLEGSQPNVAGWVPSGLPLHTDPEVLAEMPMEALVEEFKRRGHEVVMDEGAFLLWMHHLRSKEDPDFDMEKGLEEADDE